MNLLDNAQKKNLQKIAICLLRTKKIDLSSGQDSLNLFSIIVFLTIIQFRFLAIIYKQVYFFYFFRLALNHARLRYNNGYFTNYIKSSLRAKCLVMNYYRIPPYIATRLMRKNSIWKLPSNAKIHRYIDFFTFFFFIFLNIEFRFKIQRIYLIVNQS